MAITRDFAKAAAAEVRRMNDEADRLEAETRRARARASTAMKQSQDVDKQWERIEAGRKLAAGDELRQLQKLAAAAFAEKPAIEMVPHDVRRYARSMLQNYVLGAGQPPQMGDPLWGSLHGLQGRVVAFLGTVGEGELYDTADALECKLHRACLARLRWLAGEE